jgi:molybdenum cofactor guanylyltransferase
VDFPLMTAQSGDSFDPFFNINRPDDLGRARSMIAESRDWKTWS